MAALADRYEGIRETGTQLRAISADTPGELSTMRDQMDLPFELLSDEDCSVLSDWGILNEKERNGIAFPNVYVIDQNRTVVLHSRDTTASRAENDSLVEFLREHAEDSSHRREISDENKKFLWPTIESLIWGLPRKLGWLES